MALLFDSHRFLLKRQGIFVIQEMHGKRTYHAILTKPIDEFRK